jgi:hypothetical protein
MKATSTITNFYVGQQLMETKFCLTEVGQVNHGLIVDGKNWECFQLISTFIDSISQTSPVNYAFVYRESLSYHPSTCSPTSDQVE